MPNHSNAYPAELFRDPETGIDYHDEKIIVNAIESLRALVLSLLEVYTSRLADFQNKPKLYKLEYKFVVIELLVDENRGLFGFNANFPMII